MKKLLLMFAAIAAISFVSCTQSQTEGNDNATEQTDSFTAQSFADSLLKCTDSTAVAGLLDQANAEVSKLVAAGDTVAAKTLLQQIQEIINTNKDKIVAAVPAFAAMAENCGVNVPEFLKGACDSTKNALGDKAQDVVEGAKDAVNDAADKAVEKAGAAVDKAADKAAEAVSNAADKAADAGKKAAEDLKNKLPK